MDEKEPYFMKKKKLFIICCTLAVALSVGLLSFSYMSNQDDKITIGRMLAFNFENQKFALFRLQINLVEENDALLLQEIAQIEALKSYNFFENGVKKLPWDMLYEDLFKEVKIVSAKEQEKDSEAKDARETAIDIARQINDEIEAVEESCNHAKTEKQKYLNYYNLLDQIFY